MNSSDTAAHYVTDILSPKAATTWPLVSQAGLSVPGIHRELFAQSIEATADWRFPAYARWFEKGNFLQRIDRQGNGNELDGLQSLVCTPLSRALPATFIEWRYFAIISESFHGIVGISLFNPFEQFSHWAEGGLIVIVAGVMDSARTVDGIRRSQKNGELKELCWQKVFPTSTLDFYGDSKQHVRAFHEGIELVIEMERTNTGHVKISGAGAPFVDLVHRGLEKSSILPAPAEDLKRVPGAHWIVHNPSPIARVDGVLRLDPGMISSMPVQSPAHYPNFISSKLKAFQKSGFAVELSGASGYYEHSFGMNPMPLHGWDFIFAPDFANRCGLVMQTYKRSQEIRFVEVIWFDQGEQMYTRFNNDEFSMEWELSAWHDDIRTVVPLVRKIRGQKNGYSLEVTNEIATQIPFLRRNTALVKNFFISEEISFTSWKLTDTQGRVVSSGTQVPSGGETAYARFSGDLPRSK